MDDPLAMGPAAASALGIFDPGKLGPHGISIPTRMPLPEAGQAIVNPWAPSSGPGFGYSKVHPSKPAP